MKRQQELAVVNLLLDSGSSANSTFIRLPGTEGVANISKNKGFQMNRISAKTAQEIGIGLEK